jgi:hypothetical protein
MALQLNCEEDFYDAMTKPLITLALAAGLLVLGSANAASWDGTKGDLTVLTFSFNNQLIGTPHLSDKTVWTTEFLIHTTDATVSAFLVSITYTDDSGVHSESQVCGIPAVGAPGVALTFFTVKQDQITNVTVTRLHAGKQQVIL